MHMKSATCGARLSPTSRGSGQLMPRRLKSQRHKLTWKRRWGRVSSRLILQLNLILISRLEILLFSSHIIAILLVRLVQLSTLSGHLALIMNSVFCHMKQLHYAIFFWSIFTSIFKLISGLLQHLRSRRSMSFSSCTVKGSGLQKKRRKSSKRSLTM